MKLRDRHKLGLSLLLNVAAKAPSVVFIIVILPRIKSALGLDSYNQLLGGMALGGLFSLPFGGISAVGRRLVGLKFSQGDPEGQADAFMSSLLMTLAWLLAGTVALIFFLSFSAFGANHRGANVFTAVITLAAAGFTLFDNLRAAYNEHYVTAALSFLLQVMVFLLFVCLNANSIGIRAAAVVILSPTMLASSLTLILLLRRRPYLVRGSLTRVKEVLAGSVLFSMGDGALSGAISASVFLLSSYGTAEQGAWYGTFARLFQSILTPLLLIMIPLSAFVTTRWRGLAIPQRRLLIAASAAFGILYGMFGAACLAFGSRPFFQSFYHLSPVGTASEIAAISVLFLGVMSEKAYGMVVYSLDNGRALSYGAFGAVVVFACVAICLISFKTALQTLAISALVGGVLLIGVICYDATRRYRIVAQSD